MENAEIEVVLSKLSKTNYSWKELQQRPLPDGVDPSRLEQYLNNEDFQVKFLLIEDTCLLLESTTISPKFRFSAVRGCDLCSVQLILLFISAKKNFKGWF